MKRPTNFSLPTLDDKATKRMRRGGFQPRTREPGEAVPLTFVPRAGNYVVGDGEQASPSICRPGSQDALKLKSFGFPT